MPARHKIAEEEEEEVCEKEGEREDEGTHTNFLKSDTSLISQIDR